MPLLLNKRERESDPWHWRKMALKVLCPWFLRLAALLMLTCLRGIDVECSKTESGNKLSTCPHSISNRNKPFKPPFATVTKREAHYWGDYLSCSACRSSLKALSPSWTNFQHLRLRIELWKTFTSGESGFGPGGFRSLWTTLALWDHLTGMASSRESYPTTEILNLIKGSLSSLYIRGVTLYLLCRAQLLKALFSHKYRMMSSEGSYP